MPAKITDLEGTCKAGHSRAEHTRYDKGNKGYRCIECKRLASLESYHRREQAKKAKQAQKEGGHNWIYDDWDWDSEEELIMTIS